jgi:lysophospholipase L1-like esterase
MIPLSARWPWFTAGCIIGVLGGLLATSGVRSRLGAFFEPAAIVPAPLHQPLWTSKAEQFLWLDPGQSQPSLVYLGDSITDWMMLEEMFTFEAGQVLNRCINGDTTFGVLQRLTNSFPTNVEVCFLLVGYNDLKQGADAEQTAGRIRDIARLLLHRHGVRHVVLETIPAAPGRQTSKLDALNSLLLQQQQPQPERVTVLDLAKGFRDESAAKPPGLFVDGIHLSAEGYRRRARLELEHLAKHLPALAARMRLRLDSAQ